MEYKNPGMEYEVVKSLSRQRAVTAIVLGVFGVLATLSGIASWLGSQPVAGAISTGFGFFFFSLQAVTSAFLNHFETVASLMLREMRNRGGSS